MLFKISRWLLGSAVGLLLTGGLAAAPYPKEGLQSEWRQPDGKLLKLRVFGDELYGRTTTEDGYTVIFNDADQTYYYAKQDTSKLLISSGIPAGTTAPAELAKDLKDMPETVQAVRAANIQKYVPERAAEWKKRSENPGNAPVNGAKVGLTILVQFPDDTATSGNNPVNFPVSREKMERFCNEVGYDDDGNSGSIRDYFNDQSLGQLTHTQLVTAIVTMPKARDHYNFSNYPTNTSLRDAGDSGRLLVSDAIAALKVSGFDFSGLSKDSSNLVIATSLLFAGNDSGVWAKGLWPHASSVSAISVGGTGSNAMSISRYQCTNINSAQPVIGTIIHELGHLLLGYPDLYDTNSANGDSEGVGEHCLMGSANYLNGGRTPAPINLYLKEVSGWANITDLGRTELREAMLQSTGNVGFRIRNPNKQGEYFLFENRGDGDKWAEHCRDKGIAIWHIDETVTSDNMNQQMTASAHYMVSIEQADGRFDLETGGGNRGDDTDLFDNTTNEFDDYNNPNSLWWNGVDSGISVKVLSAPGAEMSVRFGNPPGTVLLGVNPGILNIPSVSATQSLTVNSNGTWTWSGAPSWITTSEAAQQSGRQTFDYTVSANTGPNSRIAILTFVSGTVTRTHTVTQAGFAADDHGNSRGKATTVAMNSITDGEIEVPGDSDYFRINVNGPGTLTLRSAGGTDMTGEIYSENGTLLAENDDTFGRNFQLVRTLSQEPAVFYLRAKIFSSSQTGEYQIVAEFEPKAGLSVPLAESAPARTDGSGSFEILSTGAWAWSTDATWVTTSETRLQNGDQTFNYTVQNNTGGPRSAVIKIENGYGTATHTINQQGIPRADLMNPDLRSKVSSTNLVVSGTIKIEGDVKNEGLADSGIFQVKFYRSNNAGITTDDREIGQITIPSLAPGETAPIDFIAQNPSFPDADRTTYYVGWIYDSGNKVTEENETNNTVGVSTPLTRVTASLAVAAPTTALAWDVAQNSVEISSNTAWTWSTNVPWVTSAAAEVQIENQTLDYVLTENQGATARTAIITFKAGTLTRTHTITQAPKPLPLVMTGFERSGDQVTMSFATEVGKNYRIMTSSTLEPGSWTPVEGHATIPGTGEPISRSLDQMGIPPAEGKRFFRIERD